MPIIVKLPKSSSAMAEYLTCHSCSKPRRRRPGHHHHCRGTLWRSDQDLWRGCSIYCQVIEPQIPVTLLADEPSTTSSVATCVSAAFVASTSPADRRLRSSSLSGQTLAMWPGLGSTVYRRHDNSPGQGLATCHRGSRRPRPLLRGCLRSCLRHRLETRRLVGVCI